MTKEIEIVGALFSRRINVGSKSECDGFFIVTDGGDELRVEIQDENPFDQPTLRRLLGARCRATGCSWYRGRYIVRKIVQV